MAGLLERVSAKGSTGVVATGATTVRTAIIDMQGADGCLFIAHESSLGTQATTGAIGRWILKGSTGDSTGSMIAMRPSGSTVASTAGMIQTSDIGVTAQFDNSVTLIDVVKPVAKRYIMFQVDAMTGVGAVTGLKYNLRYRGSTSVNANTTFVAATTTVVGPVTS